MKDPADLRSGDFAFFRTAILILSCAALIAAAAACGAGGGPEFHSLWADSPDGPWTGPGTWANRLQDWQVEGGGLVCLSPLPMRTLHLTGLRLGEKRGKLVSTVEITRLSGEAVGAASNEEIDSSAPAAGFLLGAGGELDNRAACLIHHSYGQQGGLFAGIDIQGRLFIRDFEQKESYLSEQTRSPISWDKIRLKMEIRPDRDVYRLTLEAWDLESGERFGLLVYYGIPADRTIGNLALVSHGGYAGETQGRFGFSGWSASGSKLESRPGSVLGPMVTALYTLSRGVLKLGVQFMPLSREENRDVRLLVRPGEEWEPAGEAKLRFPSLTALFRVEDWAYDHDVPFRIEYTLRRGGDSLFSMAGVVKRDPIHKPGLVLLSLSCVEQVIKPERDNWMGVDGGWFPWNWGVLFPHAGLIERLEKHGPDLMFFAGDQVYEGASPTAADFDSPYLDYLYKWYLWCLTYRPLTLHVPAIVIPDDHDVYHGNLWGEGGKAVPPGLTGAAAQDPGGYKMPPEFVEMVQATQTSHLPDPVDPRPVEQGIGVFFTECNVGGLSVAVIEDRKFKSAPKPLFPEAEIYNGWVQNPAWDVRRRSRVEDAVLLGERQLDFLERWAGDWSGGTWMKAVVSQTLFSNVATLPADAKDDGVVPGLEIPEPGVYLEGDKMVADFDSNGWPQAGRDRAIRKFRKAFATHIVGDQHLATTSRYGVEDWRDSGYVIVSPATGNIFPRRWWPPVEGKNRAEGAPRNTGDFEDGFGNKITVLAVANPRKVEIPPTRHHELVTGYSVIRFEKAGRSIELANWPYWADPEVDSPFEGWPIRFNQMENYARPAKAWLPEIRVEGITDPVFQVLRQETGEMVYTLRIEGRVFRPKVFEAGAYIVRVGEPDTGTWRELKDLRAAGGREAKPITLKF
jgi:hypothetical protein